VNPLPVQGAHGQRRKKRGIYAPAEAYQHAPRRALIDQVAYVCFETLDGAPRVNPQGLRG
jgi:hypothetical protein